MSLINLEKDKMSFSICYVSKPLQYFNAVNIVDENPKICLFINSFYNAIEIYNCIIEKSDHWERVILIENAKDAYVWMDKNQDQIENIYIDSDYGFIKNTWLFKLRKKNIFVYEEGIGSYINNMRNDGFFQKIIKAGLKLFGIGDFIGGSRFTKGMVLYDHNKHQEIHPDYKKEKLKFSQSFADHLASFKELDLFINDEIIQIIDHLKNKRVLIYLTSWVYKKEIEKYLVEFKDYVKILKPHPHLKDDFSILLNQYDYIIKNNVMIEFFLVRVMKIATELVVVHGNSTAVMYFEESDKLRMKNI